VCVYRDKNVKEGKPNPPPPPHPPLHPPPTSSSNVKYQVPPRKKSRQPSAWHAICRTFGFYYAIGGLYKLIYDLISFVSPLLLRYTHVYSPSTLL